MFSMRNPSPITAYIGVNGSGKTLSAIAVGLRDLKRWDRPLITNVGGLAAPHYHFDEVEELPNLLASLERVRGDGTCTLVMDEAGAMFSSRSGAREKAFSQAVQQLRKYDTRLLWTAPTFARADKILREVTFEAILCMKVIETRRKGKVWGSTRLVCQKAFDVSRLDHSAQAMNRNARAKGFGFVRTGRWQDQFDSFARAGIDGGLSTADALVTLREAARGTLVIPTDVDGPRGDDDGGDVPVVVGA